MPTGIYKRKEIIKTGDRFNRLIAIRFIGRKGKNNIKYWLFRCECGNKKIACVSNVKNGHTKSCGCYRFGVKRNFKHGMIKTKVYESWCCMRYRCFNKNDHAYKYYGGRGITVCKRWLKFMNFYKDMGDRPKNKTLDRINNDGNYEPNNCKWSTRKEQANNRRNRKH